MANVLLLKRMLACGLIATAIMGAAAVAWARGGHGGGHGGHHGGHHSGHRGHAAEWLGLGAAAAPVWHGYGPINTKIGRAHV